MKLDTNTLKQIVRESVHKVLYNINSNKQPNIINEGLIKTYPSIKSAKRVYNTLIKNGVNVTPAGNFRFEGTLNGDSYQDAIKDNNYIFGRVSFGMNKEEMTDDIKRLVTKEFNSCGYDLGTSYNADNGYTVLQFEPRFQEDKSNKENVGEYVFHITTDNAVKKILKNGFTPANKCNNGFNYKGRVYFFTSYNPEGFMYYIREAMKVNRIDKDNFDYNFKVIVIDTTKCPDTKFYPDPNFPGHVAVFTYDNIPPTAIKNVQSFDQDYIRNIMTGAFEKKNNI